MESIPLAFDNRQNKGLFKVAVLRKAGAFILLYAHYIFASTSMKLCILHNQQWCDNTVNEKQKNVLVKGREWV